MGHGGNSGEVPGGAATLGRHGGHAAAAPAAAHHHHGPAPWTPPPATAPMAVGWWRREHAKDQPALDKRRGGPGIPPADFEPSSWVKSLLKNMPPSPDYMAPDDPRLDQPVYPNSKLTHRDYQELAISSEGAAQLERYPLYNEPFIPALGAPKRGSSMFSSALYPKHDPVDSIVFRMFTGAAAGGVLRGMAIQYSTDLDVSRTQAQAQLATGHLRKGVDYSSLSNIRYSTIATSMFRASVFGGYLAASHTMGLVSAPDHGDFWRAQASAYSAAAPAVGMAFYKWTSGSLKWHLRGNIGAGIGYGLKWYAAIALGTWFFLQQDEDRETSPNASYEELRKMQANDFLLARRQYSSATGAPEHNDEVARRHQEIRDQKKASYEAASAALDALPREKEQ